MDSAVDDMKFLINSNKYNECDKYDKYDDYDKYYEYYRYNTCYE